MKKYLIYIPLVALFISCKKEVTVEPGGEYEDWTTTTHSSSTPDYDKVFTDSKVHRLDITIGADYWAAMQADMEELYGSSSSSGGPGGGGPGGGGPPGGASSDENPIYVPSQVYYNGIQWYDVGIRYKGNSSLKSPYAEGNNKLPFRLEFNHFEDENPLIWGQSFYGFKQVAFSSGFNDNTLLKEKLVPDLFREFGVPAPRTAFYKIYIDYGDGPIYFGMYTMVEVIFDTMAKEQFSGSGGNCYKADDEYLDDVSFSGTDLINKTSEGVYTEATNLINALTSSNRTSDAAQWRTDLESVIDMDQYLKYLAANTTIANWDTYGMMSHNFYMYANPGDGKLNWIPWDNNEALTATGTRDALDFDFNNLSTENTWPMISFIYADAVYKAQYDQYIDEFITTVFTVSNVQGKINTYYNLISDDVIGSNAEQPGYTYLTSSSDFTSGISDLNTYITTRIVEADAYTP